MVEINFQIKNQGQEFVLRLDLDPEQFSQGAIIRDLQHKQVYEPEVFKVLLRVLKPGDVMLDIGAHVGFFSMLASHLVGPGGRVVACEPIAENISAFQTHAKLNNGDHITLVEGVLSDTDGTLEVYFNSDNDGGHALWDPGLHSFNVKSADHKEKRKIPSRTLESLLEQENIDHVKLAKIDTEGSEYKIFKAARKVLEDRRIELMICELNQTALVNMGSSQDELFEVLRVPDYHIFLLNQDGNLPRYLPKGTSVVSNYVQNILVAREESVARYWPQVAL